jgi:hypothetical protein
MKEIFYQQCKGDNRMNYEERLQSMGLKPFTKDGFLAHAEWQNESRRKAIEEIDKYELINTYKVKDWMALKLYRHNGEALFPIDPVLIAAKQDNILYVFNGHYTYNYDLNEYKGYEIFDSGCRRISPDDGEIE